MTQDQSTKGLDPDSSEVTADEKRQALQDLVVNCNELRELERRLGRFNIFRVLGFEDGEIRHSNVLAWLLQPQESHGLGDLFLRRFLMRALNESDVIPENTLSPIDIDAAEIRAVDVRREWENIDVFLLIRAEDENWAIVIENKINSKQHGDQLKRYHGIIDRSFSSARKIFILLSKHAEEPDDDAYLAATYTQIHDVLNLCVEEKKGTIGAEPETLLENYLSLLEEKFMEDSEIADLATRIYKSHKLALDVILEHRPDELMTLTEHLKERINKKSRSKKIRMMATNKGLIRFIPESWATPENLASPTGKDWGYVMCELNLWGKAPIFKIFTGQIPNENWTDELWEKSKSPPFKQHQRRGKKPAKWMTVYSEKATLRMPDLLEKDSADSAEKLLKWTFGIYESAAFTEVVKTIAKMIPSIFKENKS